MNPTDALITFAIIVAMLATTVNEIGDKIQ